MTDAAVRRLGWGWLTVGLLGFLGANLLLIAHFGFGVPVRDRSSGAISPDATVLAFGLLIGAGGALFAGLGALILRWIERKNRQP